MTKIKQDKIPVTVAVYKKVKITKLTDDTFKQIGEAHPNGISEGYVKTGVELVPPTVGESYYVNDPNNPTRYFRTSPVVKINEDGTIKTWYSTYKIEYLDK